MLYTFHLLLLACTSSLELVSAGKPNDVLTRVLFGSCNKPYRAQPLWDDILTREPDLWIWTGDIVYNDRPNASMTDALSRYIYHRLNYSLQQSRVGLLDDILKINNGTSKHSQSELQSLVDSKHGSFGMQPHLQWRWLGLESVSSDMSLWPVLYKMQAENEGYRRLKASGTPIIGVWDDHDYGANNAKGHLHPVLKRESKRLLLDFLKVPQSDPRRNRGGVYTMHSVMILDSESNEKEKEKDEKHSDNDNENEPSAEHCSADANSESHVDSEECTQRRSVRQVVKHCTETGLNGCRLPFRTHTQNEDKNDDALLAEKHANLRHSYQKFISRESSNEEPNVDFASTGVVIDIYLLDVRWFQGLNRTNHPLLGAEQWNWLFDTLKRRLSIADVSVLVSGIPVLPYYRGHAGETWSRYNSERLAFLKEIVAVKVRNPILISGDVHFGEISRYDLKAAKFKTVSNAQLRKTRATWLQYAGSWLTVWRWHPFRLWPLETSELIRRHWRSGHTSTLYEITSSGLTHSWGTTYHLPFHVFKWLEWFFSPDQMSVGETLQLNFGEMEVTRRRKYECGNDYGKEMEQCGSGTTVGTEEEVFESESERKVIGHAYDYEMHLRVFGKNGAMYLQQTVPILKRSEEWISNSSGKTYEEIKGDLMGDDFIAPKWRSLAWSKLCFLYTVLLMAIVMTVFATTCFPLIVAFQVFKRTVAKFLWHCEEPHSGARYALKKMKKKKKESSSAERLRASQSRRAAMRKSASGELLAEGRFGGNALRRRKLRI